MVVTYSHVFVHTSHISVQKARKILFPNLASCWRMRFVLLWRTSGSRSHTALLRDLLPFVLLTVVDTEAKSAHQIILALSTFPVPHKGMKDEAPHASLCVTSCCHLIVSQKQTLSLLLSLAVYTTTSPLLVQTGILIARKQALCHQLIKNTSYS